MMKLVNRKSDVKLFCFASSIISTYVPPQIYGVCRGYQRLRKNDILYLFRSSDEPCDQVAIKLVSVAWYIMPKLTGDGDGSA